MPDPAAVAFQRLRESIKTNNRRLDELTSKSERAGSAYTVRQYAYADRPLQSNGDNITGFAMAIITDGLDVGETTPGTGVLCMYKEAADDWYRVADNTVVAT